MKLKNLENINWKCYKITDEVDEINNEKNILDISGKNDTYEDDYCTEKHSNIIDDYLVDLLDEVYCIKSLENIKKYGNEPYSKKIRTLNIISGQYSNLLKFKQFYYKEVQESIDKINSYLDKDIRINPIDLGWILRCYDGDYFDLEKLRHNIIYILKHLNISPKLFEKIIITIDKIQINRYANKYINFYQDPKEIGLWIDFLQLFRDDIFSIEGEIVWLIFLLAIVNMVCADDTEYLVNYFKVFYQKMSEDENYYRSIDLDDNFFDKVNFCIKDTTQLLEKTVSSKIIEKQQDLLLCFKCNEITKDAFEVKAEVLIRALELDNQMKQRYLSKKGSGCIAIMCFDAKRYVAVSGDDSEDEAKAKERAKKIEKLLDGKYSNVTADNDTRFYYNSNVYITYGDYKKWLNNHGINVSDLNSMRKRLFSCCEQKLLTKVYGTLCPSFDIYVKLKPCIFCEDALGKYNSCCTVNYAISPKIQMKQKKVAYLRLIGTQVANDSVPTNDTYDKSF